MPVYQFGCKKKECAKEWEAYLPSFNSKNPKCECGGKGERVWKITSRTGYGIFPYTTSNLTGSPIEITSPAHLRSLEKKHGVRLRDDVAYINQEWRGYDPVTKKQIYNESGRGMKGQWI